MESVFSQKPCDTCNADRQIGNPYRWQCECDRCTKIGQWRNEAIKRLSEIEDILGDEYDIDRLRELVQADREGRCAVLSTPMRPMICKPNDTDVYCPRCGETLSGGWPESDYDDYRKMVQCPNCGESIDDNKCEPEAALKGENEDGMDKR